MAEKEPPTDPPQNSVSLVVAEPTVAPTVANKATGTVLVRYKFKDVDLMMSEGYSYPEANNSTICDIVAMYLKGQKILYTEAKTVCEVRLHYLMLPAIAITSTAAILSLIFKDATYGATVVSVLNCINTFLLTLINYLKLDARSEAHRTAAYKFDKLQSFMEFNSGRILFETKAGEGLVEILKKVENDVREIKETNQFILPEKIRYEFPRLYSINVFAEVKRIQNDEALHVERMKSFMNKILELENKGDTTPEEKKRIEELEGLQKAEVQNVLTIRNKYLAIDEKFEAELEKHRSARRYRFHLCGWLKS
jgi:hypothetical protein